ncbi:hypothetical protein LCGC14_2938140, partial [marine sediment metagenome]
YGREGEPKLDKIVIKPLPDEQSRLVNLKAGSIDALMNVPLIEKEGLEQEPGMIVGQVAPGFGFWAFIMNVNASPFDDVKVRQAMNYAIDRQKIIEGLRKACYKRPVGDDQLRRILELTEDAIFANYEKEVPSQYIGDRVGEHLRGVDKVAYIRFASVYRRFQDVGELIEEAEEIRDAPMDSPGQGDLFTEEKPPA